MPSSRLTLLVSVVFVILLTPTALAQGPTTVVELHGGPDEDVVSTRGVAIVSLNVTLRIANIVCSGAGNFAVDVTGSSEQQIDAADENATEANATVHVTPASLNFPIGAGAYGSNPGLPAAQPYEVTQSIAVAIESAGLPNETVYAVNVLAKLRPASAPNCRGTGAAPEATGLAGFVVRFNETENIAPTSPELPVPWSVAPVAVLGAVLLFRRRSA